MRERHSLKIAWIIALTALVVIGGIYTAPSSSDPSDPTPNTTTSIQSASAPENFTVRNGHNAPVTWTYPVEVRFLQETNGSWNTTASVTVNESEEFHPNLTVGEQYAVVLIGAHGWRRSIGGYVYQGHGAEIVIGNCCHDDFPAYS